ncbi:MAG: tetratricopeptide repeat protein [Sphingomonas sp.]|nr:tetratricopeptide repeat protein [Sphingomonas sp.]
MIKRTIIILFMLIASPVFAQNKGTPAPPAATAEEIATLKADAHAAEKRLQELEIRDAIREAKSELDGRANTRLDIWIGVYGILFAIFAIGFGYISHRLAIAEVKKELASSRDEINELARSVQSAARSATKAQEEADTALTTAQEAAEEAQNALLVAKGAAKDAEKHRANAQESAQAARKGAEAARVLAERASTGKTVEATDKEKETLNKAVETAGPDESGWSIDQFKSAIGKALYVDENYEDAIRLTKSMAAKHGKNNEAYAYALNRLGDAQQELMLWHDAGSSYNDVITRCKGKAQNATRRHLCWAYHHYGICLSHLGQPAVAAKQFKLAVDLSKKLRGPEARSTLSARHELARAILDQGRTAEAETILKELGPVDKLDSQARQDVIQDSFCGGYLGAVADGGCRVDIL